MLKPGGTILIHRTSQSVTEETDKVIPLQFCECMNLVCSEKSQQGFFFFFTDNLCS